MNTELFNYLITVALEFEEKDPKFNLFKNAAYFLLRHSKEIKDENQINVFDFDESIKKKIRHYLYSKNILSLIKVDGIGLITAKRLLSKTTTDNILKFETPAALNNYQKIGIKYQKDLQKEIPKTVLKKEREFIKKLLMKIDNINHVFFDCVDLRADNTRVINVGVHGNVIMKDIKDKLRPFIKEVFWSGSKRFSAIYEDYTGVNRKLIIYLFKDYILGKFYLCGSDNFNTYMRTIANNKGYKLSENEFTYGDEKIHIKTEQDIFNKLGVRYISIKDRV